MAKPLYWQRVSGEYAHTHLDGKAGDEVPWMVYRAQVPGGWLVCQGSIARKQAPGEMTFISDPEYKWEVKVEQMEKSQNPSVTRIFERAKLSIPPKMRREVEE